MSSYNYFPILKTTDAELQAYAELPLRVQERILPIFELTRSRRSKNNPDADSWLRVESIEESLDGRPFILDLTTEPTLQNTQIDAMLNNAKNGYSAWVTLVRKIAAKGMDVVPVIHYNPDELTEVRAEIRELKKISPTLAFRVGTADDVAGYTAEIAKSIDTENLVLIIDASYIKPDDENPFPTALDSIDTDDFKGVICAASSFPSSVANHGDQHGVFPIAEIAASEAHMSDPNVFHGDYGSIHPIRYEGRWGGWVPRIDFTSGSEFHYYRYRREQGGYTKAAQKVVADKSYKPITEFAVWGDEEISTAAAGQPSGRSPAHWISVRANLYMAQQYLRLSAKKYSRMPW